MQDFFNINAVFVTSVFGFGTKKALDVLLKLKSNGYLNLDFSDTEFSKKRNELFADRFNFDKYNKAKETVDYCNANKIRIISFFDADFPNSLKEIDRPPIVLYVVGDMPVFNSLPSITIVGPRMPSTLGLKYTRRLSYRFAAAGMIVVSGGGIGCETEALKGSICFEEKTVVFLPCGIDADYWKNNYSLNESTRKKTVIISEYPPKLPALKFNFPARNRLIAAVSDATVVIEAKNNSGALITADYALDFGKTVYAIPGNPMQKEYEGSNKLLLKGAKPLINIFDVLEEFSRSYPGKIDLKKPFESAVPTQTEKNINKNSKKFQETLSKEAKIVYNCLDKTIFTVDDLSGLELSTDEILSALTELELEGAISPVAGGKYKIK